MPLPRLQQSRRPRGRDRTVIDESCARHKRPRPTNDRQLARPRSPQDDWQKRTQVDILPPIPIGAAESGSTRQPSVLLRLRRSRSLHDWASAHRYSAYRCYSEVVRSDRIVPCLGGRLLTRRCTTLAEGASGRVLAHRRLASAGPGVALRRLMCRWFVNVRWLLGIDVVHM